MINNITLANKIRIGGLALAIVCAFSGYICIQFLCLLSAQEIASESKLSSCIVACKLKTIAFDIAETIREAVTANSFSGTIENSIETKIFAGRDILARFPADVHENSNVKNKIDSTWKEFSSAASTFVKKNTKNATALPSPGRSSDNITINNTAGPWTEFNTLKEKLEPLGSALDDVLIVSGASKSSGDLIKNAYAGLYIIIAICILSSMIGGFLVARNIDNIIRSFLAECNSLIDRAVDGDLSAKIDPEKVNIEFNSIAIGVNKLLETIITPFNVSADRIDKIARGETASKINEDYKGDFNRIKDNINSLIDTFNRFADSINKMYDEQKNGDYEYYAGTGEFIGAYKKMIEGVNHMVKYKSDTILSILKVVSDYSEGDFSAELLQYPGKSAIANEITGRVRENLQGLVRETTRIVDAARSGDLDVRGVAENFKGGFAEIVSGINAALDAVIKPIRDVKICLGEMASGNLELELNAEYSGEFLKLVELLTTTIEAMKSILTKVNDASMSVRNGSMQLSEAGKNLADSSSNVAAAMGEIMALLKSVSTQSVQNAQNAEKMNELVCQTANNTEIGNEKMKNLSEAIDDINNSARSISKIIKMIDEIAFQTNLLALNAAVEAARAGKHGKGFSIVANEVKNLAQRSANAARETAALVDASIGKTGAGTQIANEAAETFGKIYTEIAEITVLVSEITASSRSQSDKITQINQGLDMIDYSIQQNTAISEETASTSTQLLAQSNEMQEAVCRFRLE